MTLRIGSVEIGGDNPCRFVAEVSNNHNGDLARCLRLVTAAKDAGADIIKTQCYTADELVALRGDGPAPAQWGEQGWTMRALYEKARTPFDWFPVIAEYCADLEIPWFSSVFGSESLALLESLNCPAYKIARLDSGNADLVRAVYSTQKPVLVSEAKWFDTVDCDRNARDIYHPVASLYCPPGYPTRTGDVALPWFQSPVDIEYTGDSAHFLGLSSHCMDERLPIAAVARGAKLIEMHFHLCEEPSELEANISLNQYQWRQMVRDVRATEEMLG